MPRGDGKAWARGRTAATDERVARIARAHVGIKITRRTPPEQCRWIRGRANAWSRGLTSDTDKRVRRNAEKHVGLQYVRRVPREEWSRRHSCQRLRPLEWNPETAYAVGLVATDGNLSSSGRHVRFVSVDRELTETFLRCVGHRLGYRELIRKDRRPAFVAAFSDVELYRWFMAIGITPRKSLTLGGLQVPGSFLPHVVRGLLDGDGSIYARCYHMRALGPHKHLAVVFHSASSKHLEWLRDVLARELGTCGSISTRLRDGRVHLYLLKYRTDDSQRILRWIYEDVSSPRLARKWKIWDDYTSRSRSI